MNRLIPDANRGANPSAYDSFAAKLIARYGAERSANILAGRDEAANADLAKWRLLGRGGGGHVG